MFDSIVHFRNDADKQRVDKFTGDSMVENRRSYEGTGNFCLISEEREYPPNVSHFVLTFLPTGEAIIEPESVNSDLVGKILADISNPYFTSFSMKGRLDDGFYISIEEMGAKSPNKFSIFSPIKIWREGVNPDTTCVHYGLTNLAFTGCYYFAQGEDTLRLDALTIIIDEVPIEIHKRSEYDTIVEKLMRERISHVTSEAICTIPYNKRSEWAGRLDQLSWLISFAACENVVVLYADYYDGTELIASDLFPRIRTPFAGRPPAIPIDCPTPCCFKRFLENAFPLMNKYQDKINLKGLIHLTVTSQHPFLTLEEKFQIEIMALESFCSQTMEMLKKNQRPPHRSVERAREEIRTILAQNNMHLDDMIIEKIASKTAFNHPDFKDKLEYALREFSVNFSESDLSLVLDRNEIVHYGRFKRASDPVERYHELSNLLIRILLTILDYRGEYIKRGLNYSPTELPRQ